MACVPRSLLRPSLLVSLLVAPLACGGSPGGDGGETAGDETAEADDRDTGETADDGAADDSNGDDGDGGDDGDDSGTPDPEPFSVGFDVHDLSPSEAELGPELYLGGYGAPFQRGPAEGVADPIFVRSMAIGSGEDDGTVLAVVDTVGLGNQWTRTIRADASAATGLDPSKIVIASTHTHGGPDFQGLWGGVPDDYRERVTTEIVASIAAAWQGRSPADLEVASGMADNRNRRGWEFSDQELTLLAARDEAGELQGVLVAFAAHPVVLGADNLLLSRDYCGYTVDRLEAELGVPALFFNGILGDVTPRVPDGDYADDFARAQAYGELVADAALASLPSAEPIELGFHHAATDIVLDVENQLFLLAAQAGLLDYDFDMRGDTATVRTQTAYLRLGNQLQLVAFPGESLTRNGLAVKDGFTTPHRIVLGLAGDALGYFIPSDEWQTGLNDDYEESVSVGSAAGDATRDAMLELVAGDPG